MANSVKITITEEDINLINVVFQRFNDEHAEADNRFYPCMQGWEALKTLSSSVSNPLPPKREEPFKNTLIPPMSVVPFALCGGCHHPEKYREHFHLDVYDTLAEAIGVYERNVFRNSHKLVSLSKFMNLESYVQWMSPALRESLQIMHFPWRLSWCINLLINYHDQDKCRDFISCAIKLCLKLITVSKKFSGLARQNDFIYALGINECDENIVVNCLEVFFMLNDRKASFLKSLRWPLYIMKCIQKVDSYLIHKLVDLKYEHGVRAMEECFVECMEWFVVLLEFGFVSFYSKEIECAMLKTDIAFKDRKWNRFFILLEPQVGKTGRYQGNYFQYRCLQVIDLFIRIRNCKEFRAMAEYALKLLWCAISDPYLTLDNFKTCFSLTEPAILRDLQEVWTWYDDLVSHGSSEARCPRSLQHLCRYTVRQQLAKFLQLPRGIQSLDTAEPLKKYLLLSECGTNPYSENENE